MKVDGETTKHALWSVILAGGEGERTRPFIERWLGYHKPKQYCTFAGEGSLFQRTIDRADALTVPGRRVSVVARDHLKEVERQLRSRPAGIVIPQPANRGTAPGILVAVARVMAADPCAMVVVYPSDHFVLPEDGFLVTVASAVAAAEANRHRLVVLGVVPDTPELDYGWILPGPALELGSGALNEVRAFVEKPSPEIGKAMMVHGGLWNSMVLVGLAATFWQLAWRHVPEVMPRFVRLRDAFGTARERTALGSVYDGMPVRDFSRHVMQNAREGLAVLRLEEVLWSDWGRPERIARTLRFVGQQPAFSEELVRAG